MLTEFITGTTIHRQLLDVARRRRLLIRQQRTMKPEMARFKRTHKGVVPCEMSTTARLKEDIAFLCRAIEGELRVYEKQADLLFTLLNNMAGGQSDDISSCPLTAELALVASASKAATLLEEDMVPERYVDMILFLRLILSWPSVRAWKRLMQRRQRHSATRLKSK